MSKSVKGGILLLAAGAVLLLSQLGVIPGDLMLILLGTGFCAAYFLIGGRKDYSSIGFLIPGTILLAIGGFAIIENRQILSDITPGLFFVGLGLSFLAVFLLHTFWFREKSHGDRFWPIYPAGGLMLFAALIILQKYRGWDFYSEAFNYIWVVVLLVIGLWLILGKKGK